jgi:hydrogenase maturation protease
MHLAYQLLDGYDVLVLVDACPAAATPARCTSSSTTSTRPHASAFDPHGMDPAAVLAQLDGLAAAMGLARPVGRVLVVGCEPASLDEGMGSRPPSRRPSGPPSTP